MATNLSVYGSDEISFQDCDVCKFQNVTSEALSYCTTCSEYLCTTCEKAHRGSKSTRNHTLLTGRNLPSASISTKHISPIMFCEDHKTMVIDMYCKSHDEVICSACKITSHRICTITDVSQQTKLMKKDGSFNKTKTHLEDLKSQYDKMKAMRKKDKGRVKSQLEKCLKDMPQIRKEINETLDTIEKTLSEKIQHADAKTTKDIEGHIAIFDDVLSHIMEELKILKESEKSQDDQVMFVIMKKAVISQHKYADTIAKMQQDIYQTEFKINDNLKDSLKQLQSVKTVLVEIQDVIPGITHERRYQASLLNTSISGRRDIDIGDTNVLGCTFMPDGHLVLCCGDNGIKLLDKDFKVKSQLNEIALRVAVINDCEIFVTQGYHNLVKKVKLFPQMKVTKTMKMDRTCWAVDVYGGEIYVTCFDSHGGNGEVQILNMNGKVQRRLGLNNGKYMFTQPDYVTINKNGSKVFVSDRKTHTVTCLDTQGHVVYQYSDTNLRHPQGMFVDCVGYLLVCDYLSNNVHVIGDDGRKEKVLLSEADGVLSPYCISFRQSDGCLVVGMNSNNGKSLISYRVKHL